MRRAERVANKQTVAQRSKLARKFRVVGFLFGMVADIFEQQHFPIAQSFALHLRFGPNAVRRERHQFAAEQFLQSRRDRSERVL